MKKPYIKSKDTEVPAQKKAQITLVNLQQAKMEEVFLPYLVVGPNVTLYDQMKGNNFLLPAGN